MWFQIDSNLQHPISSLLSPQSSRPSHLYPLLIHRLLVHVNSQKWQGLNGGVVTFAVGAGVVAEKKKKKIGMLM